MVAIVVLCVAPAVEKQSLARAATLGAVFGLAAYAAFDLVEDVGKSHSTGRAS